MKVKRRMIDADRLINELESRKGKPLDFCTPTLIQIQKLIRGMLSPETTCNFRNPGWEERAKEHDTTA